MAEKQGGFDLMGDLRDPRLMTLKAFLFLVAGSMAGIGLLWERWDWQNLFLLAVVIGSFSRAYYFCFYVIEHYIDGRFRYAGLTSVFRYWWLQKRNVPPDR